MEDRRSAVAETRRRNIERLVAALADVLAKTSPNRTERLLQRMVAAAVPAKAAEGTRPVAPPERAADGRET
ncbi:MAG: hypothetical protein FJ087_21610 [Deltaproteobacteria bacterium]|nr:hypothetical protein [Deltaproteobacteria bacterium]